jgi:hypothetical protein
MRKHIAWRGGTALPVAGISAARLGGMALERRGDMMATMDFDSLVSSMALPALPGATADDAAGGSAVADEAITFEVTRSGMLNTVAGAARVALRLQVRRRGDGRLVAVLLAVGLTEHGDWTLRHISVPVAAGRVCEAARVLGAMLPDVLHGRPDGTVLMSGGDGVVRAAVLSRSGRLASTGAVAERERRSKPRWHSPAHDGVGSARHCQHA